MTDVIPFCYIKFFHFLGHMASSKNNANKEKNSIPEKPHVGEQGEKYLGGALERLLGTNVDVKLERFGVNTTIQDFADEWMNVVPFEILGVEETLVFQKDEKESFIVVAPTTTLLLYLDAYLGLDIEELCSDDSLWSAFSQELSSRAAMTAEERTAFEVAASSLGLLNPAWGKGAGDRFDEKNLEWKTTFSENELADVAASLNGVSIRWSIYSFDLSGRSFYFSLVYPASSSRALDNEKEKGGESRTLQGANIDREDRAKKVCIRIAEGVVAEDALRNLKPGDVLTTDAPADKLFEAIVDGKIAFLVKAGLFQGTPAVQVKEIFEGGAQGKD